MRCRACQSENRSGVRFCEQCGARLEMICPSCGARGPADRKFCGDCGGALAPPPTAPDRFTSPRAYTPPHLAARILKDRAALSGERKLVTVLFADVAGFTTLSERLDPEDVHGLINHAFELMLAEVHRYEGTVNQFLGDGLMALFGAPIAHEDHAQRAAHAALGMQRALTGYRVELARDRGVEFRVRMGLNTGLVVVGAIGDNLRMDYTAVGDTTNTAARMQQLAEPGSILVAEATERLIAPYFELRNLGTFAVKNRAQPVTAHALQGARPGVTRLAARASQGLVPLVGRGDALDALERAEAAVRAGGGQVALVVGEAGIGKSRLLHEFRNRLGDTATWIEGDCISFGQSVAFLPIIEMLKRVFGVEDQDDENVIIAKVRRGVQPLAEDAEAVEPYLRFLLSVNPGDAAVDAMDPGQRRTRIVAAFQRLIAAASRRQPVVVVVEDAHWIDAASEDLLKALADSMPGMAALLLITYRPGYEQPFGDRTYHWRIALQPVDPDDAMRIVRATLGVAELPRGLAATIAAKAEGNPFFLEEIGRTLVETGAVRAEGRRVVLAQPLATLAVPETVQDVIAARIDRLSDPQKRTVQTAAVIGREFALSLLRRVSDLGDSLAGSLAELKRSELIYERTGFGDDEYIFKHALTQDVAYASLLQSERRRLHALIGVALEELHAGRLEERTEALVYHFTRGEVWEKVVRYSREAAERAVALFLDGKAVEFGEGALAALARLPDTPEHARAGVDVRLAMRAPLWRAGQLEPLFQRMKEAEALAIRVGETARLDTIYSFLVQYYWAKGDQERALEYGQRCLEIAQARQDLALRVTAMFYTAHSCEALGRFAEGIEHARELVALLEGPHEQERFGLSGLPYCGACTQAAWCLSELGDHTGAIAWVRRGERVAVAANHLYSKTTLEITEGCVAAHYGAAADAVPILESAVATCRDKKFVGWLMLALAPLGYAYARLGRVAEGIPLAQEGIQLQEQTGAEVNRSYLHMTLAKTYLLAGDLDRAEASARAGLAFAERHLERAWEGWNHWVLGEVAARRGDRRAAEAELDAAEDIAEEIGMGPLLERCRAALRHLT